MAFIVSLILDEMILDLTDALETEGVGRAGLVRRGPLQESPVDLVTSCLVYENDPSTPNEWMHEQINYFEIGGSGLYKRRFTAELKIYLVNQGMERASAKETIDLVHGRAIHALRDSTRIPGLVDEFGETVLLCKNGVDKSRMVLSGGPDSSWIGEGKIWFTVYTELP